MNYTINPMSGQGQFNVYVVRFNDNNFKFWMKNTTRLISGSNIVVKVIFDDRAANMLLQDGELILSLSGFNYIQELYDAINIFKDIMKKQNVDIKVHFIAENESQRQIAERLYNNLGFDNKNSNINKVETELKHEQNYTASGSKTIEVERNTGIEKITINDNKAYVNSGILSIEEQKFALLQEWKKDPYMSQKMEEMSDVEIDRMLMESVTANLTTYKMESAREQLANDKVGKVAMDKAVNEDGLVNAQLGIVENNVRNSNQFSYVEQHGENLKVVNPNVVSSEINSGGISDISDSSNNDSYNYIEPNINEVDEASREVVSEFYVDEEYNVYDNDGNCIGKVGQDGLLIDYNNNTLVKNGQSIGFIGSYEDMGKKNDNSRSKPNVRVLRKEENRSAAFISFPVIMFILSAMLLIASVVLLFVLD